MDETIPNVIHKKSFVKKELHANLNTYLKNEAVWYRVKYVSSRFKTKCTTPCYTNVLFSKEIANTPAIYQLKCAIEETLGLKDYFNVALIRLYKDGSDNIA